MIRMQRASAGPFSFASPDDRRRPSRVKSLIHCSLERALGLTQLDRVYQRLIDRSAEPLDAAGFAQAALEVLDVELTVADADLELVPREGAAIVVSNHPFGGVDGIALAALLARRRPDVKLLANELLARIEELRPMLILVDAFGGRDAAARNAAGMREALRWLQDGHLLAVFPAGEVSSLSLRRRRVVDRAWNPAACRLAERTGAPLVPAHVVGRNRARFQIAGLVHPRLRTALLPRELLAKRGARIEVRFGAPLFAAALRELPSGVDATAHARRRVEWLAQRAPAAAAGPHGRAPVPLEKPVAPALIAAELDALTEARCIAKSGDLAVLLARGPEIPRTLVELGRLREATFREVGEGTGRALDLDAFDEHYLHLVLWSATERSIAGAYRCAYTEDALRARGRSGLYTSTLFDYAPGFFERLGPALELGRSFIVPSRQRSFAPLMLLWKGIGSLVLARPTTRTLFGAVSISASYHPRSRRLIEHWLRSQRLAAEFAPFVRARTPLPELTRRRARAVEQLLAGVGADWERLAALIGDVEPDRRGLPVLVREYLELGGRFAAFNRDPEFADVLDGLVVVDLTRVPERVLGRYLGREQARAWLAERAQDAKVSARAFQLA